MTRGASAATIYSDDLHGFYEADLVLYVASKGNFPTVVVASPFGSGTDRALLRNCICQAILQARH